VEEERKERAPSLDLNEVSANVAGLLSSGLRHRFDTERQQISLGESFDFDIDGQLKQRRKATSHVSKRATAHLIDQLQVLRRDMFVEKRLGLWARLVLGWIRFWDEVLRLSVIVSTAVGALVMFLLMHQCTGPAPSAEPSRACDPCKETIVRFPVEKPVPFPVPGKPIYVYLPAPTPPDAGMPLPDPPGGPGQGDGTATGTPAPPLPGKQTVTATTTPGSPPGGPAEASPPSSPPPPGSPPGPSKAETRNPAGVAGVIHASEPPQGPSAPGWMRGTTSPPALGLHGWLRGYEDPDVCQPCPCLEEAEGSRK